MNTVRQVLVCLLLASLSALAVAGILLVRAATATVATVGIEVHAARVDAVAELRDARRDLAEGMASTGRDALLRSERQVAALRLGVLAEMGGLRRTASLRLDNTLAHADRALDSFSGASDSLRPVLTHTASITGQIDDALPMFVDCDHNPDCLFNRYVGASRGFERASQNVGFMALEARGALPRMLTTWDHIGGDIAGTADHIDRLTKPHWYDRVIGYGLTFGGAALLSGRP